MRALVIAAGGGIGDVLLATPCMRALHQRYDEVAALTSAAHRSVLAGNPDLSEILIDEGSLRSMTATLRRSRFDAAIVTWATPRTAVLPFFAGIPVRVGQARRPYSVLFTRRVTVRSELGDRTTHWTQILLDYARALGCDVADATPSVAISEQAQTSVRGLLHEAGIDSAYAVLHPTRGIASEGRRRWPALALGALGARLRTSFGVPVVVTGTQEDRDVAEAVARKAGAVSLAGRTTIAEFAALAQRALFAVAMDSGPMHMAAALGVPTVGIFALRSDEPLRWRPLGPRTATVRGTYPCPAWHRKETCPDFACVRQLPVEAIVKAVQRLLSGASGEAPQFAERAQDGGSA